MFDEIQNNNYFKYLNYKGWVYSPKEKYIDINSPYDLSNVGHVTAVSSDEVNESINAIPPLQKQWASLPIFERVRIIKASAKLLLSCKEYMAALISKEVGKKEKDCIEEVLRTVDLIEFYSEQALRLNGDTQTGDGFPNYLNKKIAINQRLPYGIVLAIPPFNYPLNEAAPKIISALLTGNACVLKTPTQGSITNLHFAKLLIDAGVPVGVLTVITGKGSEIGDTIVAHPLINVINFTGSYETAEHISHVAGIKKLILGLSGKDSAIVCNDADIDLAVKEIASGALSYSGQRCTAIKRVMLSTDIYDEFLKKFVEALEKTEFDPVIDNKTSEYVEDLKKDALDKGAKLVYGERISDRNFKPYILTEVNEQMRVAWEEPFGPILPIFKFIDVNDAINLANESEYGLQSSIFTRDIERAFDIASKLEVGTVQINGKDSRGPDHFPFTGVKKSGLGNVQGAKYLLEEVTRIKSTVVNLH